jgi:hypothetical protein
MGAAFDSERCDESPSFTFGHEPDNLVALAFGSFNLRLECVVLAHDAALQAEASAIDPKITRPYESLENGIVKDGDSFRQRFDLTS